MPARLRIVGAGGENTGSPVDPAIIFPPHIRFMFHPQTRHHLVLLMMLAIAQAAAPGARADERLTANIPTAARADADGFHMGTAKNPDGVELTLDSQSLRLDGKPWMPVMGEFHYARYPKAEWREELLKVKAGGISVVATYVFWIHHEEIEGQWDWSGRRSLRDFVQTAGSVGLKVIVRCGSWCHGEVRNGGLPDWLLAKGLKVRTDDPAYLEKARLLYAQIAAQLRGLLWKDGGPVIGVQIENEYRGPAEHLLTLKRIAREVGIDAPLYTRTGWPALTTPMPFGEFVPLYGSYAEGFWDRELNSMPGRYWTAFRFSTLRVDDNIANEQLGRGDVRDAPDVARYPYLTCEIGGGMASSYHRRILIDPADVESTALIKIGSGSTLPGYYMYHGGTNPEGRLTTLMEAQATPMTNWNDLPVKNYDFQAPLGAFGEIRPQYHLLRRLHLFLADFGSRLAQMPAIMPDLRPGGPDDVTTLRWCVRSDGRSGYVFVNNYQRSQPMTVKRGVQFVLQLPGAKMVFPAKPVDVPANSSFFWPFHLELGHGVIVDWATAQPVCFVDDGDVRTIFFAETTGIVPRFAIAGEAAVRTVATGRAPAFVLADGTVRVVVLDDEDSLALWKGMWRGRERAFLTRAGLTIDGDALRLTSENIADLTVGLYPLRSELTGGKADGIFTRLTPDAPQGARPVVTVSLVQEAGPLRKIARGKISKPVAAEPNDDDFAHAAVWRVKLAKDLDLGTDPILRIHYVGDVARVMLDGRLICDDFYNGNAFDIGLRRFAPEILSGDLRIAILPLQRDAPIFLADSARPDFGAHDGVVALPGIEIVPRYQVGLGN